MCGLVCIINPYGIPAIKPARGYMNDGLTADAVRGPHSTGVFTVDKDGGATTRKSAITGGQYVLTKMFDEAVKTIATDLAIVGHNRWATVGQVNKKNAHPFVHDTISLVHNGTVRDLSNLAGNGQFGTDSETIAYAISQSQDPNAIDVLESIRGDYVLIWHDTYDNCLRIARNPNRKFYLAKGKNSPYMLGASEPGMIKWIAERQNLIIEEPQLVPTGKLLRFDLSRPSAERIKPVVRDFTCWTPPSYSNYGGYSWDKYDDDVPYWARQHRRTQPLPPSNTTPLQQQGAAFVPMSASDANTFLRRLALPTLNGTDIMATVHPDILSGVQVHDFAAAPSTYTLRCGLEYYDQAEKYEESAGIELEVVAYGMKTQALRKQMTEDSAYVSGPIQAVQQVLKEGKVTKIILILDSQQTDVLDEEFNFIHNHKATRGGLRQETTKSNVIQLEDKRESKSSTSTEKEEKQQPSRLVRGPHNTDIALSNWLLKVIGGCACCNTKIDAKDANLVAWYGELPVCHHCHEGFLCDETALDVWARSLPAEMRVRYNSTKH